MKLPRRCITGSLIFFLTAPIVFARGNAPHLSVPVQAVATGDRVFLRALAAGNTGFYAVWNSADAAGETSLYGQLFNSDGQPQGSASGRLLVRSLVRPGLWDACSDLQSGLIVASVDAGRLKLRRFDSGGRTTWESPLEETTNEVVDSIFVIDDSHGGAYVAWDQQGIDQSSIWVQHWDAGGKPLWLRPGVSPASGDAQQTQPVLVRDGQGGVIVGWKSFYDNVSKARLQRLTAGGERLWRDHGVDVQSPAGDLHQRLMLAAPGLGDAVIAWTQGVEGKNRIFFQHVEPGGQRDWTPEGVTEEPPINAQWNPVLLGTGQGNLWVGWEEVPDDGDSRVLVVRREAPQGAMWAPGRIALASTPGSQGRLDLVLDGANGVIAVWIDNRTTTGIYLQHVTSEGHLLLGDGRAVATGLGRPQYPRLVLLPGGKAAVLWLDEQGKKHWALQCAVTSTQ